ncbi:MAG: hypothetical protein Q9167_007057 [Letrouitia subvulpina]
MADDIISIEKQQLKPTFKVSSHSTDGESDIALREDVLGDNLSMMGDLSYMIFGDEEETTEPDRQNIATIHWSGNCQIKDCGDSEMLSEALHHLESSNGPNILFGQLKQDSTVARTKMMRLTTLQVESAYHSGLGRSGDLLIFGAYYNLRGDRDPRIDGEMVQLLYRYQSLQFQYNIKSGRASYLLACSDTDFEYYVNCLVDKKLPSKYEPHPFSLHLILLFRNVFERNKELDDTLKRLLLLEDRSIAKQTKVTQETGDETKSRLQILHKLFQDILIRDNNNKRHLATIECFLRDLNRLLKITESTPGAHPIDQFDHQRIIDGFYCLKDFCLDRERRLKSRAQRVQNLIALTYNLLANRDSITSHRIAHSARQDGAAMRTIAAVTMLFFPATFVSSFLGTNLVTLNTDSRGRATMVFSDLWWIYLVSAIPLTLVTLVTWVCWERRRGSREKKREERRMGDVLV